MWISVRPVASLCSRKATLPGCAARPAAVVWPRPVAGAGGAARAFLGRSTRLCSDPVDAQNSGPCPLPNLKSGNTARAVQPARAAQSVLLPLELGLSLVQTAQAIGRSVGATCKMRTT